MKVCSSLLAQIQAGRLRFKPGGWDVSLQAQIQACRLRFKPGGWDPSLQAQTEALRLWSAYVSLRDQDVLAPWGILFVFKECTGFAQAYWLRFKPGGSDSSLEAEIQACRLRFKPGGSDSGLEAEVHPWLELLPRSLPKTSRILVLLVLFVFWWFYLFFQETISFGW